MPRDQETTSGPVSAGTRTGPWPADDTTARPDDTTATTVTAPDGRAGISPGAGPSVAAPEAEWVAGGRAAPPAADASLAADASRPSDASPVTGTSSASGAGRVTDPAAGTDPTRVTVPDLGDPDLDAVPDAAAGQSAGQPAGAAATGAGTTRLDQPPAGARAAAPAGAPGSAAGAALVTDADGYRASWVRIQSGFVDDPRGSVTEAAALITQLTNALVSAVQERERTLRGAWDGSGDADTENLRNALRDYRSFFERLTGV